MTAAAELPPYLPAASTADGDGHGLLAARRVLIVGAGQQAYGQQDAPVGIGSAISRVCAREGACVALSDVDGSAVAETAELVVDAGGTASTHQVDASDEEQVRELMPAAERALGGLDGLVMNVGVAGGHMLGGTSAADWDVVMAVNARSHFLGIKHALPLMPPGGSIVLVSSAAWLLPSSMDLPAYAASKGALAGLARYAAREASAHRVRVNVVTPSLIDTSLARLADLIKPDRAGTPIPLGRQGTAWEVANVAVFLLSDFASYVTGQEVLVDGGLVNVP